MTQPITPERRFTNLYEKCVNTGKLLSALKAAIKVMAYHARETIYRSGASPNEVHTSQYLEVDDEILMVHIRVVLLKDDEESGPAPAEDEVVNARPAQPGQ